MKKNIFYSILGIIIITGVFIILFFNISLTSLPTTFKIMLDDQIENDEQLAINNLDYERIKNIRIEKSLDESIEIVRKDEISTLLDSELRIYNGGRFKESSNEYGLYINFHGSTHRYTIAENYIRTFNGNYIVLDEHNDIFNNIISLFEEK